ncbi:4-hydroxy-tetrahydrodipicolinate reductase [Maribacter sp. 2307ULW6-5]|uniref:4-hydroxy-tetrahydrodipicolinate reductase n=1 Tax=Maribacter sp. 2307ULW6-5 TaxID=3386275 RepID=UPI0039BCCB71
MNIALFGYGKMGRMIEGIAQERGHRIVAKIDMESAAPDYGNMDVAIDFSTPEAAYANLSGCFAHGVPVICGTTGWLKDYDRAVSLCEQHKGAFIYASNFSLGVNLFFELNEHLAKMMAKAPEYTAAIEEIHHTQKLDAPSGTAITLAEGILAHSNKKGWVLDQDLQDRLTISSKRIGDTPGTHTVTYKSAIDNISIEHKAHNRTGFALGAVIAAEWILGKTGVFGMRDVLNLG